MQFQDLTNKQINYWTVIRRSEACRSRTVWWCRCVCGKEKDVYGTHLVSGLSKSCGCKQLRGKQRKQWRGYEEISSCYWKSIKRGADGNKGRRCPVAFDITIEYAWNLYLQQDKKCALSGLPIVFGFENKQTASLDRIDSSKGYVNGNIQWVHKDVNRMKNVYDQSRFVEVCKAVARNYT